MFHCRLLLSVVAVTILIAGCRKTASTDSIISDVIRGGMSVRDEVIGQTDGLVADYQVYRDKNADGVVFKYIYAEDVEFDPALLSDATVNREMISMIRGDANQRRILEMGIYLKFAHVSSSGEVVAEATITLEDL